MAEAFPRARVTPGAARWAREVERRLGGVEDLLDRHDQRVGGVERLVAAIKGRDNDGAMNYRGPWGFTTEIRGGTAVQGGYVDNFAFPGVPPHVYSVSGGARVIPFVADDTDGSGTAFITVHGTFEYDVPDDFQYGSDNYYGAYFQTPATVVLSGDTIVQFQGGVIDSLSPRVTQFVNPGHVIVTLDGSGYIIAGQTAGLVFNGRGYGAPAYGSGGSWTSLSVQRQGSSQPQNTWRSGVLGTAGVPTKVGISYAEGDVVSWENQVWIASADPQGGEPGIDPRWTILTPAADDAYSGGWTP